eukprot:gene18641-20522_t
MSVKGRNYAAKFIASSLIVLLLVGICETKREEQQQKIILLSFDGFRWDYKNSSHYNMTNLHKLITNGVTVDHVRNVFPTDTNPNHQSIITGLYPEHHGIIDNRMFDERNGTKFDPETTEERWWNEATPIWITNEQQGHRSAVCYWPGANVRFNGTCPPVLRINKTSSNFGFHDRIDRVLKWMKENENVTFAAVHFDEPDKTTHEHGSDPKRHRDKGRLVTALSKLDIALGYLINKLNKTKLNKETNIIIIGDHGGVNTNHTRVINIDKFINATKVTIRCMIGFTFTSIWPQKGHLKRLYTKLKDKHPHLKVYLKKDIPNRFHIKNNNRTAPLILLPDPGWVVKTKFQPIEYLNGNFSRGEHGYSSECRDMNPGFVACGPTFRHGVKKEWINTVDLYPLMCHILGIKPLKNDGKFQRVREFLKNSV